MNSELFNIRYREDFNKYYPILIKWWEDWGMDPLNAGFLPDNGVIVKKDDKYLCAGWFYRTEVPICLMGHYISCKDVRGEIRAEAMNFLIKALEQQAKRIGFELISTFVRNPNLIHSLEELGYGKEFKEGAQTNLVKRI